MNNNQKKAKISLIVEKHTPKNLISSDEEVIVEKETSKKTKDEIERDDFAKRLKTRDENATKKIKELGDDRLEDLDLRKQLLLDKDLRKEKLPEVRERAREEYLKNREKQKIEQLKQEIRDEETLFDFNNLTKKEKEKIELNKQIVKLAEERLRLEEENIEGYTMPEDYLTEKGLVDKKRKEKVLYARYTNKNAKEESKATEQEQWERNQTQKSRLAVDSTEANTLDNIKEYELMVDENQIEFVMQQTLNAHIERTREIMQEIKQKETLPIYAYKQQLLEAIEKYQVLIIEGETGSGKTTQLPQYLYEHGYTFNGEKKIGCTQPRRVAAMSVASRVASEMKVKLGHEVGYSIRFEDCTTPKTVIKYMTDGMLLREFMNEPDLSSYSCLIIDEAHERTLHTDILFGLIKDISRFRKDMKIIISSATLNATRFSEYFDEAPRFKIPGRPFPIDIYYTAAPEANYLQAVIVTIFQIHISQEKGDILVFLTGQDEIEAAQEAILNNCKAFGNKIKELIICPIYSSLPSELQNKIFDQTPQNARKVVLATNIAETSITIDNIYYVIDPGFSKQKTYNPKTGMESLLVTPCSRASADQRAGRAGRTGPGKCFRLYTEWAYYKELEESPVPEIQRTNLGNVVLLLKSLGIDDIIGFDFMDPPSAQSLIKALEQIYALGGLNSKGELTKLGRRMAEFPLDPMMSKMIIASEQFKCTDEIVSISAMLSIQNSLFYRPTDKKEQADQTRKNLMNKAGDHITLLNIWNQWVETGYSKQWCYENYIQFRSLSRARDVREQLLGLLERVEVELTFNENPNDITPILKSITAGYFYQVAKLQKQSQNYKMAKSGHTIYIHPTSALFTRENETAANQNEWVIYYELVLTTKEYMRQIVAINPVWLVQLAPHYFTQDDIQDYSKRKMPKSKPKV